MSKQTRNHHDLRFTQRMACTVVAAIAALACIQPALAQLTGEFHQTFMVTASEPVTIEVEVPRGELQIFYSRDGQVSITGSAKGSADSKVGDNYFKTDLAIEQNGNHFKVRHVPSPAYPEGIAVLYRIDVPYRTEVASRVNHGKQTISGILGPVKAVAEQGDIKVSYVSKTVQAQADTGNIDVQVIGERIEAATRHGNISCARAEHGVSAETEDGDITLMVVGPSIATVKKGSGRIDVGGARGGLVGSTDAGDLHVKAIPHDDWHLSSASGNVRLELPPAARLELDASTDSGAFQVERDDMTTPGADFHHFDQKINGGGKRIEVHTSSGKILIR